MNRMEALNFNRLHLHLTDGPGWRLEIRKYPRLTSIGAWRKQLSSTTWNWKEHEIGSHFTHCYGGFYTQEEMRQLIGYGAARGITIVPEIDLPGHAYATLVAYPQLALEPPPACKLGRDILAVEKSEVPSRAVLLQHTQQRRQIREKPFQISLRFLCLIRILQPYHLFQLFLCLLQVINGPGNSQRILAFRH